MNKIFIYICLEFFCLCTIASGQNSYIIVHAHNPEGVEIGSIQWMGQYSVLIFDGDTYIGSGCYNSQTHNNPIAIPAGAHTVTAVFNGMTLEQSIIVAVGEIQTLTFTFTRTNFDIRSWALQLDDNTRWGELYSTYGTFPIYSEFVSWFVQSVHNSLDIYTSIDIWTSSGTICLTNNFTTFPTDTVMTYPYVHMSGGETVNSDPLESWAERLKQSCRSNMPKIFYMSSIPYDLFGTGVCDEENQPPFASFTYLPEKPNLTERMTFDASSSSDSNGSIIGYKWDFGDGEAGYGQVVTHSYTQVGEYAVKLMVTDNDGLVNATLQMVPITLRPPVASFTYPAKPMVGGNILFDASESHGVDNPIVSYQWDFDDGSPKETVSVPIDSHVFPQAKVFNVKLIVTDSSGLTGTITIPLDLSLRIGDIFLCRTDMSFVPGKTWGHAGIYAGKRHFDGTDVIIEALPSGVVVSPISRWSWPEMTYVCVLRADVSDNQAQVALDFASSKIGEPYNLKKIFTQAYGFSDKDVEDTSWYCSELVWAAYMVGSYGLCDLDLPWINGNAIAPDEISMSPFVQLIGEHKEEKPETYWSFYRWIGGVAYCPVELNISDPSNRYLDTTRQEIPGGIYEQSDLNEDGDADIFFAIPSPMIGDYQIKVVAKADAQPNEKYSLYGMLGMMRVTLSENISVKGIPVEPYKLNVSEQADSNNDGRVDFIDFARLSSQYNNSCSEINYWCKGSDIDTSGLVDISDLALLAGQWLSGN